MNGRRFLVVARVSAGPLALAGFFLPWAQGPGVLAGEEFTGFTLLGFAGRLQHLDFTFFEGGLLLAARLAILGVVIAAAWQTLLAPAHHWHRGYEISGWYLAGFTTLAFALGGVRSGLTAPPSGLAALALASTLFLAGRTAIRP